MRIGGRFGTALATAAAIIGVGAGGAAAQTDCAEPCFQRSTPGTLVIVVPAGATHMHVDAIGGRGGTGWAGGLTLPGGAGGFGARVQGTIPVTPGQTFYAIVGDNGRSGEVVPGQPTGGGGANGGGNGGTPTTAGDGSAGGGGGATDLRTSLTGTLGGPEDPRILVAGGGGGGGASGLLNLAAAGGAHGQEGAGGDAGPMYTFLVGGGGKPGTASAGGAGGAAGDGLDPGTAGGAGSAGFGGHAAVTTYGVTAGGGGGGGWYGGGAGGSGGAAEVGVGSGGGGGGGSSYTDPVLVQDPSVTTDATGQPRITVTFTIDEEEPDDTTAPVVTLTSPVDGATFASWSEVTFEGVAGLLEGDLDTVHVQLFDGPVTSGTPRGTYGQPVDAQTGAFSVTTLFDLGPGVFTARALQEDAAGNTGSSAPVTFTIGQVTPPAGSYDEVVLGDDPVGYWRLGESSGTTLTDSSPNANHGIYQGGFTLGQTGAIPGNTATLFNGTNGLGRINDSDSLDTGDTFTAEAWIKRTNATKAHQLFLKGSAGMQITIMGGNGQVFLRKPNVTTIARSDGGVPADGQWHHVVATMDGPGTAKIYIDGAPDTVGVSNVHTPADSTTPLFLGGTATTPHTLDELALYDKALTPEQVAAHHAAATATNP